MKAKRSTIIIDGNFFMFKCLYSIPKSSKDEKLLSSESDRIAYIKKLAIDFAAEIRKFYNVIDRVIFAVDSSSWRKDYYPKKEYKGNRVKDVAVDWDSFHLVMSEFKEILKSKGVIIHQVPGAEGDDIIYAWSSFLNLMGENVIIVSGDQDLMQLVCCNESTDSYTITYTNTNKKVVVDKKFNEWLNSVEDDQVTSIFDLKKVIYGSTMAKNTYKELISSNNLTLIVVDADEFIFKKILTGDRGDNIMSVYHYEKNGKTYSISDKKADRILELFEKKYGKFKAIYYFDKSYRQDIVRIIKEYIGADSMSTEQILDNMETNVMLMMLHTKAIPDELQKVLYSDAEKMFNIKRPDTRILSKKETILEGSQYANAVYVPRQFDFFKSEEKSDMSFIKKDELKTDNKSLF